MNDPENGWGILGQVDISKWKPPEKDAKPIGGPVFTWQEHMRDILALVASMDDEEALSQIARAGLSLHSVADGRRGVLRAVAGKRMF